MVYDSYIRPFRLLEQLGLSCGYEKSFKLTQQHLLPNRYLLGIDRPALDQDKLTTILDRLEMPQYFVDEFTDRISAANLLLIGFEEGIEDCIYKIYLEYWDAIRSKLEHSKPPYSPETLFLGYKWSALESGRAVLTDYLYYPKLNLDEIIERLEATIPASGDAATFDIARQIVMLCADRVDCEALVYLEAGEADNPRKSFDINLYPAAVRMEKIYPLLQRLCRCFGVEIESLDKVYKNVHFRELGHISGGTDRNGNPFFTVYYDNQADTRQ